MTDVRFSAGDRVEAVEHNDATRKPRKNGRVKPGIVTEAGNVHVAVLYDDGQKDVFYQESSWRAWDGSFFWRLAKVTER